MDLLNAARSYPRFPIECPTLYGGDTGTMPLEHTAIREARVKWTRRAVLIGFGERRDSFIIFGSDYATPELAEMPLALPLGGRP
jgi:hypothetical protein